MAITDSQFSVDTSSVSWRPFPATSSSLSPALSVELTLHGTAAGLWIVLAERDVYHRAVVDLFGMAAVVSDI